MANQDSFWFERETRGDDVAGAVGSNEKCVQLLSQQENHLRLQVNALQTGLDQSLQLQSVLLQRLESQTPPLLLPDTNATPEFFASTPAPAL